MKPFTPKSRITFGLVGIMVSLVMVCFSFNIIPDRNAAIREGRAVLAESIAVYSSALVKNAHVQVSNLKRLNEDFNLLVERNSDLYSLALRKENNQFLVVTQKHERLWVDMAGEYSRAAQIRVPIWAGEKRWGQLELVFQPLSSSGFIGWLQRPLILSTLFIGFFGFILYYFYLDRVLRQLDPSQAVPDRVRSALDTMAEGLLILDKKEQIVLANQAFADVVGKNPNSLLGVRASELPWIDTEGRSLKKDQRPWVDALLRGETNKDTVLRMQLPNQAYLTFKTNSSPVLGDGKKFAGVLVSFNDITELEEKEVELINSKLEAEEANRAKSSFLANMSHEIRTPMNAILGFTDILKRGYVKNEKESLKYLNTIHSSGKNLLELINDILDLSKIESDQLVIESMPVEPYSIVHEVIQILKVKADEKGIGLNFKIEGRVPAQIVADPARLRQSVLNLVGNAIKFTEAGEVSVCCTYQSSDKPHLKIDIHDTGIGMTEEAQKTIFDPFVQADNSVHRRFGGTGLGLAISLKFIKAMDGDLSVRSQPGQGSVFTISLPSGEPSEIEFIDSRQIFERQASTDGFESSRWSFSSGTVLVVDDGVENRELIKLLLEQAGLCVDEAENGQHAIDKVENNHYDVILMDINMPVMDGFTAVGILREQKIRVPIIALTANAMKGYEQKCLDAGYSGYLSKPIDIDQFMELIAGLLQGEKIDHVAEECEESVETFAADRTSDLSPIVSRLSTSNDKLRKIICRFVTRLSEQLVHLDEAVSKGDMKTVAELAHWLKGAGGTVGFDAFTEPATQLERAAQVNNVADAKKVTRILTSLAARIRIEGAEGADPCKGIDVHSGQGEDDSEVLLQPIESRLATNERLHKTIIKFIDSFEFKLTQMRDAVAVGNVEELANLAHWLKGAGGTVGFDTLTDPASELEVFAKSGELESAKRVVATLELMSKQMVRPQNTED